jgi:addiction module RelE/StbE family toxin
MRIRWTSDAATDFENIAHYLHREHASAAGAVIRTIVDAIGTLIRFPNRGRPGTVAGTRELVLPTLPYIVVYSPTDQTVQLLHIFHAAQDWS